MISIFIGSALTYPQIDPILVEIGPLVIRWYALAYIVGLVLGWYYAVHLINLPNPSGKSASYKARQKHVISREDIDDFVMWATLGVILGGRLGYVLFYNLPSYADDPMGIFRVWQGGMSFHGGLIGVSLAMIIFTWRRKIPLFQFTDIVAAAAPVGLFLGRIANFINGELYGQVSDAPWAMVFPGAGPLPRHPSQLYEAVLEGLILFIILWFLIHKPHVRQKHGLVTGMFLTGYAVARLIVERFRLPDEQLGYLFDLVTMGQVLSLPMLALGLYLIFRKGPSEGPGSKAS